MSWATTTYTCTRCDVIAHDLGTWGVREYVLTTGIRIPLEWTLGWCFSCNNVRAVELLDAEWSRQELTCAQADLSAFGPRPSLEADPQGFTNWAYLAGVLADAQDVMDIISRRDKPLHCLGCGSYKILPWETKNGGAMKATHGPCGEPMEASEDGFRIAPKPTIKQYTVHGKFIEEIDVSGYSMPDSEVLVAREVSNAKLRGLWSGLKPDVECSPRPWWSESIWQRTAK